MKQINKRNIAVCIILSIVTLGIYSIYWTYLMIKNIRMLQNDNRSCTGEMLCYIFVPFYSWYWWYTRGERVKKSFDEHNCRATGSGVLYLILCIFGFPIINMALMQNDFNSFEDDGSLPTKQNFDISDTNYITNGAVSDSNDIQSSTPKSYSKKAPMPYEKSKKILLSAYAVFAVLVIATTVVGIVYVQKNVPKIEGAEPVYTTSSYSSGNDDNSTSGTYHSGGYSSNKYGSNKKNNYSYRSNSSKSYTSSKYDYNKKDGFVGSDGKYHKYIPQFGDGVNNWMKENW